MIRARKTLKLRKLLVIDDDERTVIWYRELLTPYGFQVLVANDGEQAIPLVETNPDIQLVILDLAMPRMDGRQWLRWFRSRSKESPVIVITGYEFDSSEQELHPAVVLGKPVDVAELLDMVGLFCGLGTPIATPRETTT
ncbi:MAG: response regulator [Acidobacteria bacterium]|nr:response regulator [Acidobacteriota bacterium]MBV9479051.1 response regulator [Acidobacteriota bacterium]